MAGDETPKGQRGLKPSIELRIATWLVRLYLAWVAAIYLFIDANPQVGIGLGVGVVGLAVIATRPADQRG